MPPMLRRRRRPRLRQTNELLAQVGAGELALEGLRRVQGQAIVLDDGQAVRTGAG